LTTQLIRWKPLEAALALLGGLSEDVRDLLEDEADSPEHSIELASMFEQVIPSLLDQSATPFLQGRAFVFASQYAGILPESLSTQYLAAAVSAMGSGDVAIPVKISAVRTVKK
jgi:hypothetical protein